MLLYNDNAIFCRMIVEYYYRTIYFYIIIGYTKMVM